MPPPVSYGEQLVLANRLERNGLWQILNSNTRRKKLRTQADCRKHAEGRCAVLCGGSCRSAFAEERLRQRKNADRRVRHQPVLAVFGSTVIPGAIAAKAMADRGGCPMTGRKTFLPHRRFSGHGGRTAPVIGVIIPAFIV